MTDYGIKIRYTSATKRIPSIRNVERTMEKRCAIEIIESEMICMYIYVYMGVNGDKLSTVKHGIGM